MSSNITQFQKPFCGPICFDVCKTHPKKASITLNLNGKFFQLSSETAFEKKTRIDESTKIIETHFFKKYQTPNFCNTLEHCLKVVVNEVNTVSSK